jgi:3'-phosphoadenosine 5'-phosphosulfate sulfotransferase (PAPS reductase)/FAD synthetase
MSQAADFFVPDLPEDTIYHVGISGGKDSTAVLAWMLFDSGIPHHKIDVSFCDTMNEHDWTYDQVRWINENLHPVTTLQPKHGFFDLAIARKRFPSVKARFCTEELKIIPTKQHITGLFAAAKKVVAVSGVRAGESDDRSKLEVWDYSNALLTLQWRPIIKWTLNDVLAYHEKHGLPLNKLYAAGAERVGCWPCIMSKKKEIRNISLNFPERIEQIEREEIRHQTTHGRFSSFFYADKVPPRFRKTGPYIAKDGVEHMVCSIRNVAEWSLTGHRAKGTWEDDPPEPIACNSGFCE